MEPITEVKLCDIPDSKANDIPVANRSANKVFLIIIFFIILGKCL